MNQAGFHNFKSGNFNTSHHLKVALNSFWNWKSNCVNGPQNASNVSFLGCGSKVNKMVYLTIGKCFVLKQPT